MSQINASLFKNDRKETERQPDFTGPGSVSKEDFMAIADAITGGKFNADEQGNIKIRVAGWKKQAKSGVNYISLSISVDDYGLQEKPAATTKRQTTEEDLF